MLDTSGERDQVQQTGIFSPSPKLAFDPRRTKWLTVDNVGPPENNIGNLKQSSSGFSTGEKQSMFTFDSRSSTPDSTYSEGQIEHLVGTTGRLPTEVYDKTLNWWRAAIRRRVVMNVEWESKVLADMQAAVRTPFLDAYFVYTSSLGTHAFFMTVLPAIFFFGYAETGRGLLFVLAVGVYASSFVKDLICAPRPFAPPVQRLTIGNHHLEYGFPSTHSTNSVSLALFIFSLVHKLYHTPISNIPEPASFTGNATDSDVSGASVTQNMMVSSTTYYATLFGLLFYVFSIVYGRLYTAMHSFTDCTMGVLLGTGIWAFYLAFGDWIHTWLITSGWIVPAVTVPLCLLLVHRHPQPVDDCPCFEDAIAFMSVLMGEMVARWYMTHAGYDETFFMRPMPGSSWRTWNDVGTWFSIAAAKMVVGVLAIFTWRIVAKSVLHLILPPIFRLLSHLFTLPHRRFYTPATDYTTVPPEKGLRPIPSVIDLPGMVEVEVDAIGESTSSGARRRPHPSEKAMKQRGKARSGLAVPDKNVVGGGVYKGELEEMGGRMDEVVKHYDADVLTKVFVYSGIAAIATGVMPVMFEVIGWGVKTS